MRCPICGREAETEVQVCPHCGTDFAVLESSRRALPVSAEATQAPKKKPAKKWILWCCIGLVSLLLIGIGLSVLLPMLDDVDGSYVLYKTDIQIGVSPEGMCVSFNGTVMLAEEGYHDVYNIQRSLDGSTLAFLKDSNELVLVRDGYVSTIDNFVGSFLLSANGDGLLYLKNDLATSSLYSMELYHYTPEKGSVLIRKNAMLIIDQCISPDGQTAACTFMEDAQSSPKLLLYCNGQREIIATDIYDLYGMSNDGKYIYGSQRKGAEDGELFCISSNGRKSALGAISEPNVHLNADHTQILFYRDSGSYLSTQGAKPHKLSDRILEPLMPPNTQAMQDYYVITQPANDLYNKVYLSSEGSGFITTSAWYVSKHDCKLLASPVDYCTLDSSGQYLYYLQGKQLSYLSVTNRSQDHTFLTSDVAYNRFCLNVDATQVLYTAEKTVQICSAVSSNQIRVEPVLFSESEPAPMLAANGNGNFYYALGDRLYFTNGDQGAVHILDGEILTLEQRPNGYVYVKTLDNCYLAAAGSSPVLLWERTYHIELT